jgi:hypothetical protein
MVASFVDRIAEEGAHPLQVGHDDEGTPIVLFQLAAWDRGRWLASLSQHFGCALAPAHGKS